MSRIDDALRRAGPPATDRVGHGTAAADVFVSPWTSDGLEVEHRPVRSLDATVVPFVEREPHTSPSRPGPVRPSPFEAFRPGWKERLVVSRESDPFLVDQFRRLAAMLLHAQRTTRLKSVMVTSAEADDGKTLTALNLALVLSESFRRRVLLVEGDLRRPAILAAAGLSQTEGLSESIRAGEDHMVPLVTLTETLTLLPAGSPDPDPLSGLASARMQRLLKDAAEQFDWVIVDTPPLGAAADASLLCPMVDGAILVIRAGRTACDSVQRAIETLGRERILGVVLNGIVGGRASEHYHTDESARMAAMG
jgi:protein-tyrosine kinase